MYATAMAPVSQVRGGESPAPREQEPGERVSRAYVSIRDLIIHGRIGSGERLIEAELGLLLGISRTPVREALSKLEHEGFVVPAGPAQRKRLVVAPMSGSDFLELCGLIGAYEGMALATIDRISDTSRASLAERLAGVNGQLRCVMNDLSTEADTVFDLLTSFHTTFFDTLAGPRLRTVYGSVRPLVERYEWAYADLVEGQIETSLDEHDLIIAAVRTGAARTAEETVRMHWERSGQRVAHALARAEAATGAK